jgi:hypothetical protein
MYYFFLQWLEVIQPVHCIKYISHGIRTYWKYLSVWQIFNELAWTIFSGTKQATNAFNVKKNLLNVKAMLFANSWRTHLKNSQLVILIMMVEEIIYVIYLKMNKIVLPKRRNFINCIRSCRHSHHTISYRHTVTLQPDAEISVLLSRCSGDHVVCLGQCIS